MKKAGRVVLVLVGSKTPFPTYYKQTNHWFLQGVLLAKVASIKLSNQIWMFSVASSKRASRIKLSLINWQTTELIVSSPYRNWISIEFRRPLGTTLNALSRPYSSDTLAVGSNSLSETRWTVPADHHSSTHHFKRIAIPTGSDSPAPSCGTNTKFKL